HSTYSHFSFLSLHQPPSPLPPLPSSPTRRSSDLQLAAPFIPAAGSQEYDSRERNGPHGAGHMGRDAAATPAPPAELPGAHGPERSEEHTSELQSRFDLVCRLLPEKKNEYSITPYY